MDFSFDFDGVRNAIAPVRCLSPEDGRHYFFGYYDLMPYSPDERRHLAGRLPFDGVLNGPEDVMEFGWIEDGKFEKLFETTCWNFQQGILATYQRDGKSNVIFYNVLDKEANCYRTVRHNLDTGKKDYSSMACGTVSPDGKHGLGINFSRIWDFRPGYGYPNLPDPYFDIPQPREDGVFLCDFDKGTTTQLFDCETLGKRFPLEGRENTKMVVNHITLNPAGDHYLFLYRSFPDPNAKPIPGKSRWTTVLFGGDIHGNVNFVFDEMVSHYWWEDNENMIAYARPTPESPNAVWRINMRTGKYEIVGGEGNSLLARCGRWGDIHCSISPDGRFIIGDGYPKEGGYRQIYLYEIATDRTEVLLETYSPYADSPEVNLPGGTKEARTDLHVRWNHDGSRVSFDAMSRGHREIFEVDMTRLRW
ncbi:MAG: hypothetical protein J6T24_05975 [Clostridia bacterium]|nr:hypothetical protein [Clostridia bacterium]